MSNRTGSAPATDPEALADRIAVLEGLLEATRSRLTALEDTEAIKRLQRIYGYYLDKGLWDQIIPLFSDDCSIEISGRGVYRGHRGVDTMMRVLLGGGRNGLPHGRLLNHMQLQGVVHVDPDGQSANGRWRAFIQAAELGKRAIWSEGVYEMRYVKAADRWRIRSLIWYATYYTPFATGWQEPSLPLNGPSTDHPPDAPPTADYEPYPGTFVPPFHYPNPITGAPFHPDPPAEPE